MTERQEILMPYVEHMAARVIRRKEEGNVRPLSADSVEILGDIHQDALECMRELCRAGRYTGSNNLNNPMLIKKES